MQHPAQLRVCHELIAAELEVHENRWTPQRQFCSLLAYAWCYECDLYVCDIHRASRHLRHTTRVEFPEHSSSRILQS